jgi:hypothetical protein
MKKKRSLLLGLVAVALLALAAGCGSNKNLEPESDLVLSGADPPSQNIGVNPPLTHVGYFVFTVNLSDQNLSAVPEDAWTVDSYDIAYTILSDPGQHLLAPPEVSEGKLRAKIHAGSPTKVSVTLITDAYLRTNASGLVGTSDTATIKAHLIFRTHRNKDGYPKTITTRYLMTLGNF